jgi:hypothetical protein
VEEGNDDDIYELTVDLKDPWTKFTFDKEFEILLFNSELSICTVLICSDAFGEKLTSGFIPEDEDLTCCGEHILKS